MLLTLRNQKGLTLIELLAALTITTIVIGAISMLLHYTNSSTQDISSRESILKESRFLMNTISDASKSHLVVASSDATYALKLDVIEYGLVGQARKYRLTGEHIYFRYDSSAQTVTMERLIDGVSGQHVMSTHVSGFTASLTDGGNKRTRIALDVTVQLPKQNEHQSSTVVYVGNPDNDDLVEIFD